MLVLAALLGHEGRAQLTLADGRRTRVQEVPARYARAVDARDGVAQGALFAPDDERSLLRRR